MSGIQLWPGSGGGSPVNPNGTYEPQGWGTGDGTSSQSGGSSTKGSTSSTLGTTAAAWWGFSIFFFASSTSNARFLIDVSFDGGSTWAVPNLYANPGAVASMSMVRYDIPRQVPSGSDLRVRNQSSTGSATIQTAIEGWVTSSSTPPGFANIVAVNANTADTRAGVDVAVGGGWTTLSASTANTYGAIFSAVGVSAVGNPAVAQSLYASLATGAAASEVEFLRYGANAQTTGVPVPRGFSQTGLISIPSGSRVSAQVVGASGTDTFSVGFYGLY